LLLLVDDVEDNRDIYAQYLRFLGYRVEEAIDGRDALEKVSAVRPDLVVIDLSLPFIDGRETTRRLKADPRTMHIPVLVLTGHLLLETEQAAREAGADGYVAKPCLPEELADKIEQLLGNGRGKGA
jgi:CheY-like chemotaxis protein